MLIKSIFSCENVRKFIKPNSIGFFVTDWTFRKEENDCLSWIYEPIYTDSPLLFFLKDWFKSSFYFHNLLFPAPSLFPLVTWGMREANYNRVYFG